MVDPRADLFDFTRAPTTNPPPSHDRRAKPLRSRFHCIRTASSDTSPAALERDAVLVVGVPIGVLGGLFRPGRRPCGPVLVSVSRFHLPLGEEAGKRKRSGREGPRRGGVLRGSARSGGRLTPRRGRAGDQHRHATLERSRDRPWWPRRREPTAPPGHRGSVRVRHDARMRPRCRRRHPSWREQFAGSDPRDGCDREAPIAPQNRRFSGVAPGTTGGAIPGRPLLLMRAIGPANTGASAPRAGRRDVIRDVTGGNRRNHTPGRRIEPGSGGVPARRRPRSRDD